MSQPPRLGPLAPPPPLEKTRSPRARYVAPTAAEREALRGAVAAMLRGESARAAELAAAAGFVVEELEGAPFPASLVREATARGGGAYVFRRDDRSRLVVEAPHTFHDEHTLPLGWAVFVRSGARMFAVNTVHRYRAAEPVLGRSPADVAHAEDSLFHAATLGAVDALGAADVVQIHGFGSESGGGAAAVVSNGDKALRALHVDRAREGLSSVLGARVDRFGAETEELGATTNVQGALVRRSGGRFLHVELASEVRTRAARDEEFRARVADAITRALEAP